MTAKRVINIGAKIIVVSGLILVIVFLVFHSMVQKRIREQLAKLSPAVQVKFSSLHADIFSSSISFDSLSVKFTPYQTRQQNSHYLFFPSARLGQISFLKFLFNKNLVAANLNLDGGTVQLDQFLLDKKDSAQSEVLRKIEWPFKKVSIQKLELRSTKAFLHSETNEHLVAQGDIKLTGISVDKPGAMPRFNAMGLKLSDINYPQGSYKIQAQQLTVNSSRETAEIKFFRIVSTTGKEDEARISNIKITGFDLVQVVRKKVLEAEKIMIGKSRIAINGVKKLNFGTIPFNLEKIHAAQFQFQNASILYSDNGNKCTFVASAVLYDLEVGQPFGKSLVHFSSLQGSCSDIRYSDRGYHNVEIKNVEADNNKVRITDLKVIPQLSKYAFGRKLHHQANWVQAYIPNIEIIKPQISKLFDEKLVAEKVTISNSKIYIFRDRRLPREQKYIPLPVAFITTLPLDIRVKTFEFSSAGVAYEEYPREGYGQTGILRIERVNAIATPLINHPISSDPAYITMQVKGSIMGSGTVHGTIIMPFQKNKAYHIKGAIEKLELTKLNSSSENLGKIRIKSGFLDFLSFDFMMTDKRSTGKIIGAYHRLIIQQLKKHTDEKNVADFASFMLRHLIIPLNKDKSLPERKRTGLVSYPRDPTRYVSHYFLQSLLMGVKKSFTLGFLLPK